MQDAPVEMLNNWRNIIFKTIGKQGIKKDWKLIIKLYLYFPLCQQRLEYADCIPC